eukprot:gene39940-49363_t
MASLFPTVSVKQTINEDEVVDAPILLPHPWKQAERKTSLSKAATLPNVAFGMSQR